LSEVVMRAMAADPADRFATARQMREALIRCLGAPGASNREHDVTASLAALMETPELAPIQLASVEAVPETIELVAEPSSGADVALCEVEIIEASGPIQSTSTSAAPQPCRPEPSGPHWSAPGQLFERVFGGPSGTAPGLLGWRRTPEQPPHDSHRSPLQHAVELFDRGIELRVAGRYGEALQAWERAAALAPENRVYRSNVARLREQLDELRRAQRRLTDWSRGHMACGSGPMTDD
jgi:tetratricopeptide (TPR) repeat protein